MISKLLTKLYDRWNKKPEMSVHKETKEARYSFVEYKKASEEFKQTIQDNGFYKHLVYDKKGGHKDVSSEVK